MTLDDDELGLLTSLAHSPVRNYVIPGLTSSLIGGISPFGTVRLFQNSRDHQEPITPHSHRFDFVCMVLRGQVRNRMWTETQNENADLYQVKQLDYCGTFGQYEREDHQVSRWQYRDLTFSAGESYSMKSHEVHSIYFSRGAVVLFFEGPKLTNHSIALEPVVDGKVIPTLKTEPWMFLR